MLDEPRKFYKPGELTTWFKRLFTPPTSIPPAVDLAERRAVLAELVQAGARWDAASLRYQHAIDTTRTRVEEARDALRLAEAASAAAQGAMMAASGSHDVQIGRLKGGLQAGASSHIAVFVSDVFDQIEVLRARGVDVHESEGPPDINDHRQRRVASNADSVRARMAALVAAKSAAEALAFEALSDEEVVARLTTLRDTIPDVQPLMIETGSVFTPYELRAAEWRAEEAKR